MPHERKPPAPSRRGALAALGGLFGLAPFAAQGQTRSGAFPRRSGFLSVTDFGAKLDGTSDDLPAVVAAMAALPARGGTIRIPDSERGMRLGGPIVCDKRIRWEIGALTIHGAAGEWIFILRANGCALMGSGEGSSILRLSPSSSPLRHARLEPAIRNGAVTGFRVLDGGRGYNAAPRVVLRSESGFGATGTASLDQTGAIASVTVTSGGHSYAGPPKVVVTGGGNGAILVEDVQHFRCEGLTLDLARIPDAIGLVHKGGWYFHYRNLEVLRTGCDPSSIGIQIESIGNRKAGRGSFGGAYVGRFENIVSNIVHAVGHGSGTSTCTQFDTIDVSGVILNGIRNYVFNNPVVQQPADDIFWHLTNVDGVIVNGGDFEGVGTLYQAHGTVAGVQVRGALTAAFKGIRFKGDFGTGSVFDECDAESRSAPLRWGSAGTAGARYQNSGWSMQGGHGLVYEGRTYNSYMNLRPLSETQGVLADTGRGGIASFMNDAGEIIVKHATAGPNPRQLVEVYRADARGVMLPAQARLHIGGKPVLAERQPAPLQPQGGSVVDGEARAAIEALRTVLRSHGLTE